jgi:hypothetical protein
MFPSSRQTVLFAAVLVVITFFTDIGQRELKGNLRVGRKYRTPPAMAP